MLLFSLDKKNEMNSLLPPSHILLGVIQAVLSHTVSLFNIRESSKPAKKCAKWKNTLACCIKFTAMPTTKYIFIFPHEKILSKAVKHLANQPPKNYFLG